MDINQINTWPPVAIGLLLGLIGYLLRRFTKNSFLRILGLVLIIAAIAIIVSQVIGFPLLWTALAWVLGAFEWIFLTLATLSGEAQQAVESLLLN